MRVTEGLPDFTAATFRDWFRGKIPLRFRLGVGTERDSLAFLNETPDAELRMGARAMGLTDDQAEDALAGIRTGVMPWPTGDPRMKDSTKESNDA
jgi:hypothetical protein